MTREEIINGLKMSMELTLFDPSTGEVLEPRQLNDINRTAYDAYKGAIELLEKQPERKKGRWIESNPQDSKLCRLMTCSECGKAYIVNINIPYEDWTEAHKFCVECGADMRGEQWFEHMPSAQPDTTTHDSNVVKKGGNDEDRTSGDCISRQAAKDIFTELYGISAIGSVFDKYEWADICETTVNELPPIQPELDIGNDGTLYISVSKGQLDKINRVLVEEDGSIFCKQFY